MKLNIKKKAVNIYYEIIYFLEDVFGSASMKMNKHRKDLEKIWWDKYLS
jgi:hypothetical protein